jgi:hypothetical protein
MWILPVTRRDLVELITPRRGGDVPGAVEENRPSFDIVRSDTMAAVWPARPAEFGRMPTAIIVPEGSRRDSLAWLATYVRDFRPFTAYCRVVEVSIAELFLKGPAAPNLMGTEGICSGLILGEALTHTMGRASIVELPTTTYSATLSHAISRTLALTGRSLQPDVITKLWTQTREITGQNGLAVPPNAILSVWAVALRISGKSRTLFEPSDLLAAAWQDLITSGEIRDPVWQRLVEGYPGLERMRGLLEMPREQRVQIIDGALRFLVSVRPGDDERRGFLAGYFTSLLGPGTLDHVDFLAPVAAILPTAYLWYGLFAGVNMKGDALPVGNPLARRIVRDLTIPDRLIDRPRCDVALEELTLHGLGDNPLRLTAKGGRLDIDILPGVTTAVRWPPHDKLPGEELQRARDMELQHLLVEMEETTMRWRHLTERLRETLRMDGKDHQATNRRKRGGKS